MSTSRKREAAKQLSLALQLSLPFTVPRGCRHQAHTPCDGCAPMVRTPGELREAVRAAQNVSRAPTPARASRPGRQSPKPKTPKFGVRRPPASTRKSAPPSVDVVVSASM